MIRGGVKFPEELIQEVEGMGDYWERRLVTERNAGLLIAGCHLDESI